MSPDAPVTRPAALGSAELAAPAPAAASASAPGPVPDPMALAASGESLAGVTTLFTDIEGSTRLWETQSAAMRAALAAHDALAQGLVAAHGGRVVKTTGDGLHAVFADAADAVRAMVALARALADPASTAGLPLPVRLGAHCGADEWRGGDYYGRDVNRAARLMGVAHGGQLLVSQAVVDRVGERWPAGVSTRDLGLVRLRDLAEPQRVHQLLHAGLRASFPALRSLEATPNNLPAQLNRFIGRAAESAALRGLLAGSRLVTVLGLGGLGKSRLAVQLAAEMLDEFPDGVWFAELAGITEASLVPATVAGVLGVQEEPGRTLTESIQQVLRDRRTLLVVDNCEHVVAACAELVKRLLRGTRSLRVLATSREALNIAGESCYALPALAAPLHPRGAPRPAPLAEASPEALMDLDAVRLFVDRAQSAQRGFVLAPVNAPAVASICAQLDGIPLALELAAARVRSLSVQTLADRLADRFRLLRTTDQTVLPRQRTLRALIDWSHELLDDAERRLFARLSVFTGGFTLEAAEAVAPQGEDDPLLAPPEVLDRLASLVEKSLVSMAADGSRYRLLDTVRAYAADKLAALPEEALGVADRHLGFYLGLAEAGLEGSKRADASAWMARLDLEQENLLAAQRHAIDRGGEDAQPALRLAYALGMYWTAKGLVGLSRRMSEQALARPGAQAATPHRVAGLLTLGQDAYFSGDAEGARPRVEEAIALSRAIGSEHWLMRSLAANAYVALARQAVEVAEPSFAEALALARQAGDDQLCASVVSGLLLVKRGQGDLLAAGALAAESLAFARRSARPDAVAVALINAAMVALDAGQTERVPAALREVIGLAGQLDAVTLHLYALDLAMALAAEVGEPGEAAAAARWAGHADRLQLETGLQRDPIDQAFVERRKARLRDALGEEGLQRERSQGERLGTPEVVAELLAWLNRPGGLAGPGMAAPFR